MVRPRSSTFMLDKIPFEVFKSRVEGSEVSSQCTGRQKTLDSQQSIKAVDGGHSCGIWAPWSTIKSSYVLGHHLKAKSQEIRVWNSSEVHNQSETLESQSWSTVVDFMILMDGFGLRELIHVLIGLICHGNQHHGRI